MPPDQAPHSIRQDSQDPSHGPAQPKGPRVALAKAHPSFHSARMYFFTKSMMLSSQTQKEKPLPAMFSWGGGQRGCERHERKRTATGRQRGKSRGSTLQNLAQVI